MKHIDKNKLNLLFNAVGTVHSFLLMLEEEHKKIMKPDITLKTLKILWKLRDAANYIPINVLPFNVLENLYHEVKQEIEFYENFFKQKNIPLMEHKGVKNNVAIYFLYSYKDIYQILKELVNINNEEA